jgi:hypothetical protein
MIDIGQWRASIGLWQCSCQPYHCLRSFKSSTVLGQSEKEHQLSSIIDILLILSGNVELNPGPKTAGNHHNYCYLNDIILTDNVCKVLSDVLRENLSDLSDALKNCLPCTAELMYSKFLITEIVRDSKNFWKMTDEFNNTMKCRKDVPDLQHHCQLFLDCLSCQGGPPLEAARALAAEWTKRIHQQLEISLPFDIRNVDTMETILTVTSSTTGSKTGNKLYIIRML